MSCRLVTDPGRRDERSRCQAPSQGREGRGPHLGELHVRQCEECPADDRYTAVRCDRHGGRAEAWRAIEAHRRDAHGRES